MPLSPSFCRRIIVKLVKVSVYITEEETLYIELERNTLEDTKVTLFFFSKD